MIDETSFLNKLHIYIYICNMRIILPFQSNIKVVISFYNEDLLSAGVFCRQFLMNCDMSSTARRPAVL